MKTPASSTLIVMPYVGEFGWELMNWQGRVRWMIAQGHYRRIIVCGPPDRRPLYADSMGQGRLVFCPIHRMDWPGFANEDHRVDQDGRPIPVSDLKKVVISRTFKICRQLGIDTQAADIFTPDYRSTMWPTTKASQRFCRLRVSGEIESDIVLVPRRRHLSTDRNQSDRWWSELGDRLRARGLRVTMYQSRVDRAIRQLSHSRLAIGASTGGLHLAGLCGCPHYVWGSGPQQRWTPMQITNRQRYETVWNPLATPCRYDECGWKPSMQHVATEAGRALDEIGLVAGSRAGRRGSGSRPFSWARPNNISRSLWAGPKILSRSLRWHIKRRLARVLETPPRESIWPWPVQRLVRDRLV